MGKISFQQGLHVNKLEKTADLRTVTGETGDCDHFYKCLQRHLSEFYI